MRDGVVSVAEPGVYPSVSLLRALKREFGFYCIELVVKQAVEAEQPEMAYVLDGMGRGRGGEGSYGKLSSMERYDASSGQWSALASMGTARLQFGSCMLTGELYVIGGWDCNYRLSSVEKYTPSSDSWSAVGSAMYSGKHLDLNSVYRCRTTSISQPILSIGLNFTPTRIQ
jgi:hypothetical protein